MNIMKKKKLLYWLRYVIILFAILLSTVFYLKTYDVTTENLETKLQNEIKRDDLEVVEVKFLNIEENAAIVRFNSSNEVGFALIQKGLNQKYQISDFHMSQGEFKSISYMVKSVDYTIILGERDYLIDYVTFYPEQQKHVELIGDNKLLMLRNDRGYEGAFQISSHGEIIEDMFIENQKGNSWKNMLMIIYCVLIVLFSYLLTIPLNFKIKQYKLQELNSLPMDDQRLKQFQRC